MFGERDLTAAMPDPSAAHDEPAAASPYRRLRVAEVIAETADAISIVFEQPDRAGEFAYRPGQFLTLRLEIDGRTVARCYSLASAPGVDGRMKVTVKRVADGIVSNWLCDNLKPGQEIDVLPPAGIFSPASLDDDLVLVAGGSGITPIMAIVKSVLRRGRGDIALLYANRDEASVIFRDELNELMRAFPRRLRVHHWLESVQGVPHAEAIAALLAPRADTAAFVCGPEAFMDCVVAGLAGAGLDRRHIHVEKFVSLSGDPGAPAPATDASDAGPASELIVTLDGQTATLRWPDDRALLDVLLAAGMKAPYSCREGKCSACACRLVAGEARMVANDILEQADLDAGWILSCQARPLSDQVEVSFDG